MILSGRCKFVRRDRMDDAAELAAGADDSIRIGERAAIILGIGTQDSCDTRSVAAAMK